MYLNLNFNEILNNGRRYLILKIGKDTQRSEGSYEIELLLSEIDREIEFPNTIVHINFLKSIAKEPFKVWATYQYLGLYRPFDIIQNGRVVTKLTGHMARDNTKFFKAHTTYMLGNEINELINYEGVFWDLIKDQVFAFVHTPHNKKSYIIPCSEIYRSCFGKYESAILDVTFLAINQNLSMRGEGLNPCVFNPITTIAGNEVRSPIGYIHLRKQFTIASALFAYRLFKYRQFETSYNSVTSHLTASKRIQAKFPAIVFNEANFNSLVISKNFYFVARLNGVRIENEERVELEFDRDNSKGEKINENTEVVPGTRVQGVNVNGQGAINLPVQNGPVDGVAPALNIENEEEEQDPYTNGALITETRKEYKKTITETAKIVKRRYSKRGFKNGNGVDPNTNRNTYSLKENELVFEYLNAILILLRKEKGFASTKYYLDKPSHPLAEKALKKSWVALKSDNEESYSSRNIGIIHVNYEGLNFYLIEIQSKKSEKFAMGIVNLNDFSLLDPEHQFENLKNEIIEQKGVFKKMSTSPEFDNVFKVKFLKHFTERFSDKDNQKKPITPREKKAIDDLNKEMVKNIISKIKNIVNPKPKKT
jgi:hypothetical protein